MQSREALYVEQTGRYLVLANDYFKRGQYAEAIKNYCLVLQCDMWNLRAYYNLGIAYVNTKELNKAIKCFSRVIKLSSNHPDAYIQRADVYRKQCKNVSAIEDYKIALQFRPNTADLYYKIGLTYDDAGMHLSKAFKAYTRAIELNPDFYDAYMKRADIHYNHSQCFLAAYTLSGAIADYKKAIEISPLQAEPHYQLGLCFNRMKDSSSALECFNNAITRDSSYKKAYLALARKFQEEHVYANAKIFYEAFLALEPNNYAAKNDLEVVSRIIAIENATSEILSNTSNSEAYLKRGDAYSSQADDFEKALSDYNKALELRPDYAEAYVSRGRLYEFNRSDTGRAMSDYDYALMVNPHCYNAYLNKGRMLIGIDLKTSLLQLDMAIKLEPSNSAAYWLRGDVYGKLDFHAKSLFSYLKAHRIDRNDRLAIKNLDRFFYANSNKKNLATAIIAHPNKDEREYILADIIDERSISYKYFHLSYGEMYLVKLIDEAMHLLRDEYRALTKAKVYLRKVARYISQGQRSDKWESSDGSAAPASAFFGMPDEVAVMIATRCIGEADLEEKEADRIAKKYLGRP